MEELVSQTTDLPAQECPLKTNRGRFQRRDPRINREGRPSGSKAGNKGGSAATDLAPRADRLKLLTLPQEYLFGCLRHRNAASITNLPEDVEIIASRADHARGVVVLTIRSQTFPRVARGTLIPAFEPAHPPAGNARVFMPGRYLWKMYAGVPGDA